MTAFLISGVLLVALTLASAGCGPNKCSDQWCTTVKTHDGKTID